MQCKGFVSARFIIYSNIFSGLLAVLIGLSLDHVFFIGYHLLVLGQDTYDRNRKTTK